jgi:hypothetical protein
VGRALLQMRQLKEGLWKKFRIPVARNTTPKPPVSPHKQVRYRVVREAGEVVIVFQSKVVILLPSLACYRCSAADS